MLKAPRGHTSIYLCEQLKNNWQDFQKFMIAKGFSSFNQYNNNLMVHDFTSNYEKYVGGKSSIKPDIRIDYYNDTSTIAREKLNSFTDGQVLDNINQISDWRLLLMREAKKRGIKI